MNFTFPIREKLKVEEIKAVLKSNPRNLLLFTLAICTGLRCSDCLKLKAGDMRGDYIQIKEAKTSKSKKVIINDSLKALLVPYIKDMKDSDFLFISREGDNKPITRSQARRIISGAASKVGLQSIGFHGCRKTLCLAVYRQNNNNIALAMLMMGHESEKTTLRYLGLTQDSLDEAILKVNL